MSVVSLTRQDGSSNNSRKGERRSDAGDGAGWHADASVGVVKGLVRAVTFSVCGTGTRAWSQNSLRRGGLSGGEARADRLGSHV